MVLNKDLPEIKGFQEVTLIDWEGKVASVIFLAGCNFRCGFCHSRNLVLGAEKLKNIPFEDIVCFLKAKRGWVDGVVITGGEPTLWREKLLALISAIKDAGFLVKLDTNGTGPKILEKLINTHMLDYVSMDIKVPLSKKRYSEAVNVDVAIEDIIYSKDLLLKSDIDYEFRTTVVPGIVTISDISEIAKSIIPAKKYCIQQFLPKDPIDTSFLTVKPYPSETLRKMASLASDYVPRVIVKNNRT